MQEESNDNLEAIKRDIVELVTEHWRLTSKALLLSKLGVLLGQRGFDLKRELAGRKLAAFIESELLDKLRIIPSKSKFLVFGVVPKEAEFPGDIEELFEQSNKISAKGATSTHIPRALWLAFVTPLAVDKVRTVDLKPKIRFQDVFEASAAASGKITISRNNIVDVSEISAAEVDEKVQDALSQWLKQHHLNLDQLMNPDRGDTGQVSMQRPPEQETGSLFERLIETLSQDDLRRIQMPLDVVTKLMNTR